LDKRFTELVAITTRVTEAQGRVETIVHAYDGDDQSPRR
jgi:hypothetical protein